MRRNAGSSRSKWIGDICGQRIVYVFRISFVKYNTARCVEDDRPFRVVPLLAHTDRGNQGTDTDSGRAQVVDLIDLQAGIDFAGVESEYHSPDL